MRDLIEVYEIMIGIERVVRTVFPGWKYERLEGRALR